MGPWLQAWPWSQPSSANGDEGDMLINGDYICPAAFMDEKMKRHHRQGHAWT
jgi:hypothetical protein